VDNEIAYRWSQEVSAMGKLSNDELEMVYKTGIQPTVYLANNILSKVNGCNDNGAPDKNDKILTCDDGDGGGQDVIFPLVKDLITALEEQNA
jgi:hypothetical protein